MVLSQHISPVGRFSFLVSHLAHDFSRRKKLMIQIDDFYLIVFFFWWKKIWEISTHISSFSAMTFLFDIREKKRKKKQQSAWCRENNVQLQMFFVEREKGITSIRWQMEHTRKWLIQINQHPAKTQNCVWCFLLHLCCCSTSDIYRPISSRVRHISISSLYSQGRERQCSLPSWHPAAPF